jgi:hypothetical protein
MSARATSSTLRALLYALILSSYLITSSMGKIFSNLGCPSYNFLVNEIYLSGGLNAGRELVFWAENFYQYPKMLFWLRIIPNPLTGGFTSGYLLKAAKLFELSTFIEGGKLQLGIHIVGQNTVDVVATDVANKELLVLVTAPINYDDTPGRLTVHVGDLTPLGKITSSTPNAEEIAILNVTFKAKALTMPAGRSTAFYDPTKTAGRATSELRLGAWNNACTTPSCTVGNYRGAIKEFNVLPFVILTDNDFNIPFHANPWSLDGSRLNKEFVYYTFMNFMPGGMDCIQTARSTGT